MANDYAGMLERFAKYRKEHKYVQDSISEYLGITQSRYNKLELGNLSITNEIITSLYDSDWDVDYIITGEESKEDKIKLKELLGCSEANEDIIVEIVLWAFKVYVRNHGICESYKVELSILQELCYNNKEGYTVFYILRKVLGYKQEEYAKLLNITTKRCRKFEKGEIYPTADLLRHIYTTTKCRPTLMLNRGDVRWNIIEHVWIAVEDGEKENVISFIKTAIEYIKNDT